MRHIIISLDQTPKLSIIVFYFLVTKKKKCFAESEWELNCALLKYTYNIIVIIILFGKVKIFVILCCTGDQGNFSCG